MTEIYEDPQNLVFIQNRAETNDDLVREYAEMMQSGIKFDAAQGIQDDSGQTFIWDGWHRGQAAKIAGTPLRIDVRSGSKQEAEWLALSANQKHGLRRPQVDKQHVIRAALLHPYGVRLSNREIARHCGVSDKTVGKIRCELEASAEITQIEKRLVNRGGIIYEQDTRNIGGNSPCAQRSPGQPAINPVRVQEFECPRCEQEKIVGVNGSRRWCLNCGAEWPDVATVLEEAQIKSGQVKDLARQHVQSRFEALLAGLQEEQLGEIEHWLDELEQQIITSKGKGASSALPRGSLSGLPAPSAV
jgi:hypothetical protein